MAHLNRLGYIDAIRGIAAVAVIYFHSALDIVADNADHASFDTQILRVFSSTLDLGKIAVVTFFCVSGFVIPFSLLRGDGGNIRNFLISRFFRLYPAYWCSIIVALAFYHYHNGFPLTATMVVANTTMLQQFFGIQNLVAVYWTLQIELTFYVLCIVLFVFGLLATTKPVFYTLILMLLLALVMAGARFIVHRQLPVAMPLGMTCMLWGFLWRRYVLHEADDAARWCLLGSVALAILLPPICLAAYSKGGSDFGESVRYVSTYVIALAAFMLLTTWAKINNAFVFYLGAISYSLYLVGTVIQKVVHHYARGTLLGANGHVETLLVLAVSVFVAGLSYRFVERPCIDVGRKLIKIANDGRSRGTAVAKHAN